MARPGPMTAAEMSEAEAKTPWVAACLHPLCDQTVVFRKASKGRQKMFCSGACRARYSRERASYIALWLRLEWTAGFRDSNWSPQRIHMLQRRVEWHLERYGGADSIDTSALPQPPQIPLDVALARLDGECPDDDPLWRAYVDQLVEHYKGQSDMPRTPTSDPLTPRRRPRTRRAQL